MGMPSWFSRILGVKPSNGDFGKTDIAYTVAPSCYFYKPQSVTSWTLCWDERHWKLSHCCVSIFRLLNPLRTGTRTSWRRCANWKLRNRLWRNICAVVSGFLGVPITSPCILEALLVLLVPLVTLVVRTLPSPKSVPSRLTATPTSQQLQVSRQTFIVLQTTRMSWSSPVTATTTTTTTCPCACPVSTCRRVEVRYHEAQISCDLNFSRSVMWHYYRKILCHNGPRPHDGV